MTEGRIRYPKARLQRGFVDGQEWAHEAIAARHHDGCMKFKVRRYQIELVLIGTFETLECSPDRSDVVGILSFGR